MHRVPPQESSKDSGNKLEKNLQIVANIATVIAVPIALATGQPLLLGLAAFAALVAVIFMIVALAHRKWWLALASLAVMVVAAIGGTLGHAYNSQNGSPNVASSTQATNGATTTPASASSGSKAASTTQPDNGPRKLFDGEVTLKRNDSVDVDHSPAQIMSDQSGAVGEDDLYFDPGGLPGSLLAHGGQTFYLPPTSGVDPDLAYAACKDQYDPNSSDRNSHPFSFIGVGSAACFKTSEDHLAWLDVEANTQPISSEAATSVTMHVIVWAN